MLALEELESRSSHWLYLRLFYTETSLGWEVESDFWYRNKPLFYFVATASSAMMLFSTRSFYPGARTWLDLATISVLTLVAAPAFATFFFMVGKYNLFPLNGVERMDKFGCCTQALVFPRSGAVDLLEELRGHQRGGQTDALIEEYADRTGYERFALAPQVVQHVGLISSRNNLEINTKSTWAFWFEAQNGRELHHEHMRLAAEVDWQRPLSD
ncbi:uncharacterized protein RCC_11274 [Ramularia collo-cygni]|uniref:Uncharacterized protein n=1 Tax=Ramularia collo-cygni TaxID=112498 RepID=A0A2D3VLG4_9PEZI|nr:uncharacterized protein RCC_11274 [Ramularia collo-cygni]CZT25541.1 uncharacterized protein RCC_11274 [Ramularia collo-cygni]